MENSLLPQWLIVALRDDRSLLCDPAGLVSGRVSADTGLADQHVRTTLYPSGFSAARFVSVIEDERVWEVVGAGVDEQWPSNSPQVGAAA